MRRRPRQRQLADHTRPRSMCTRRKSRRAEGRRTRINVYHADRIDVYKHLRGETADARADRLPQFVIAGAPKAGTTALHAALATHPGLYLSPVKEPKYYLTDGRPPPRSRQRGPGDAHSAREWVWRRDGLPRRCSPTRRPTTVRGESTPFYLYDREAQRPAGRRRPGRQGGRRRPRPGRPGLLQLGAPARRRPRAGGRTSWPRCGWRSAGSPRAGRRSGTTAASAGTASSCATCTGTCRAIRCSCCATGSWSTAPRETLDRVSAFLGVATGIAHTVAPENVKPYVADTPAAPAAVPGGAGRRGARVPTRPRRCGARLSRPLLAALHAGRTPRPPLPVEVRREVLEPLLPDIALLEELTGESFADWKGDTGRGDFRSRRQTSASGSGARD